MGAMEKRAMPEPKRTIATSCQVSVPLLLMEVVLCDHDLSPCLCLPKQQTRVSVQEAHQAPPQALRLQPQECPQTSKAPWVQQQKVVGLWPREP